MNSAVIVAAGKGKRFGNGIPKQFRKILGRDVIDYSLSKFINHSNIDEVIIVCHYEWLEYLKKRYGDCKIIEGGKTRNKSVFKGIKSVSKKSKKILIHDAARPIIATKLINECIYNLDKYDCVAPIIDIKDSIVRIDKKNKTFIDRNEIKIVQTPQCFNTHIINELYNDSTNSTDEISLALKENTKYKIKFISGSQNNIKITTLGDLVIAESILKEDA